ncbi:hypothetical protein [Henriciella sp.]|nr:hypothetical protein [Henriciella sp.]
MILIKKTATNRRENLISIKYAQAITGAEFIAGLPLHRLDFKGQTGRLQS